MNNIDKSIIIFYNLVKADMKYNILNKKKKKRILERILKHDFKHN